MSIAFVRNSVSGGVTSQSSISVNITNTAGNLIIATYRDGSNGITTSSVSDILGNNWINADPGGGNPCRCYYASNCKGGSNTVKVSINGTGFSQWFGVWEFSGLNLNFPRDIFTTGQSNTATTISSSPFSTTHPNELIFSFASYSLVSGNLATWSSGTGDTMNPEPVGATYSAVGFRIVSSIQSQVVTTFNMSGTTGTVGEKMTLLTFSDLPSNINSWLSGQREFINKHNR